MAILIAEEKHRWFKMNGNNPTTGLSMLIKPLSKRLESQLDAMDLPPLKDDIPTHLTATHLFSALVAILTDWVMDDMPEPPEKMDETYQSLAEPTLQHLLNA